VLKVLGALALLPAVAVAGLAVQAIVHPPCGVSGEGVTVLQIKQIEQNLQLYAVKHRGEYPTTDEGLAGAQKYFPDNEAPVDAWGNHFLYFSPGPGDVPYALISLGADGLPGGEREARDIASWALGGLQ